MRNSMIAGTFVLFPLLLVAAGCGGDEGGESDDAAPSCEEDTRDEEYVAGLLKTGDAGYAVSLIDSVPAPPTRGDNIWTIELKDDAGSPAAGLSIDVSSFMPDHGHGTPVIPTIVEGEDGVYTIDPVNLFMPGYWETTLTIQDPGPTDSPDDNENLDAVVFRFCIEG